ncbi:MAG: hypothetical protein F4Y73_11520 [Gemmatimonadetes bacterium]|nr:hypothetical protein [Gemmatimonadota bacterium]
MSLSKAESTLLTTLAVAGRSVFATGDAYAIRGKGKATRDALDRLVRKGWLERIARGKYLIVPLEAGPERTWTESAHVIARELVSPAMVSNWSALAYWNLTEQVPRITYVQTTSRKEDRTPTVLGMRFRIVRVKPRKFFGSHRYYVRGVPVLVTGREKTIVDCLDRPDLCGGVEEVARALMAGDGDLDWNRVTDYLSRFGSGAVVKRLGFLAESSKLAHPPEPELRERWIDFLTAGIGKLDPSSPRKPHRVATRWRIAVNLPEAGPQRPG